MIFSRQRLTQLLAEGVVVLVSILLAFVLEGWREDRGARRELIQELASVQRELEHNRDLAAAEILALARIGTAGEALSEAIGSAHPRPFAAVDDTVAVLAAGWGISYGPSLGAVDALIASGRLSEIEDPELRIGLAGLREFIEDVMGDEKAAQRIFESSVIPLLVELGASDWSGITEAFLNEAAEAGITPQERLGAGPMTHAGAVEFPTDPALEGYVRFRRTILASGAAEFRLLRSRLDDLIQRIAEERS